MKLSRRLTEEIPRYVALGGANTVLTTGLLYALSLLMPMSVAYTVVYVGSLCFVVCAAPRFVFGRTLSIPASGVLMLWYLVVFAIGLGTIGVLSHDFGCPRWLVMVLTVAITSPLGFIGARLLVYRSSRGAGSRGGLSYESTPGRTPSG